MAMRVYIILGHIREDFKIFCESECDVSGVSFDSKSGWDLSFLISSEVRCGADSLVGR